MAIRNPTLADRLVEEISGEIFKGVYEAGENLPPIRKLAANYGVTVPTTQRAIARLEDMGLLAVRQGSGMRVQNPKESANLAAYPYWISALREDPALAREVLADFLELRRELAASLFARLSGVSVEDFQPAFDAILRLEALEKSGSWEAIAQADIDVVRALLAIRPQFAFASVFNVFERLLLDVEELQEAMYPDVSDNVAGYRAAIVAMNSEVDGLRDIAIDLLKSMDEMTLKRFEELLEQRRRAR